MAHHESGPSTYIWRPEDELSEEKMDGQIQRMINEYFDAEREPAER